jgi:O-antigen ligase
VQSDRNGVRRGLDIAGVAIAVALGGWIVLSAAFRGGSAWPQIELLLACSAVLVVARIASSFGRWVVPIAVLGSAVVVALVSTDGILSSRPLDGPFGYANAKSAFAAFAVVAGLMLLHVGGWFWIVGVLGAAAAASVPFASESTAASAIVVGAVLVALVGFWRMAARPLIVLCGAGFLAVLAATSYVGATHVNSDMPDERGSIVSRQSLWHDAIQEARGEPLLGVGPGRFSEFSPTSLSDPDDAHWAHHAFLQETAEVGLVGGGLLVVLFVWAFVRLFAVEGPDGFTALAAYTVAALGSMGCVDYVMHFPAIPIAASALIGAGMVSARSARRAEARIGRAP